MIITGGYRYCSGEREYLESTLAQSRLHADAGDTLHTAVPDSTAALLVIGEDAVHTAVDQVLGES